jgi:hypothetical protein
VSLDPPGVDRWTWRVANGADTARSLDRARVVLRLPLAAPVRVLRHGWQSWSPSDRVGLATVADPGGPDTLPFAAEVYLGDAAPVTDGTVRSSLVTVLEHGGGVLLAGFLGGSGHDGVLRVRPVEQGVELVVEAYLGGAVLAPGEVRELHPFVVRGSIRPRTSRASAPSRATGRGRWSPSTPPIRRCSPTSSTSAPSWWRQGGAT